MMLVQTLASLCLARRIKACYPHVRIVIGGANADGGQGSALLEAFRYLDFSVAGKSDISFPRLLRSLADHSVSFAASTETRSRFGRSPGAGKAELQTLVSRYRTLSVCMVDNILHTKYRSTLLPALGRLRSTEAIDVSLVIRIPRSIASTAET